MKPFRYAKAERLNSKKEMSELFQDGHFLYSDAFKLIFLTNTSNSIFSLGVSVPKKRIKTAVARNKIKRRTRECVRQKNSLIKQICANKESGISAMLIYRLSEIENYANIEASIEKLFAKLEKILLSDPK